MSVYFIACGGFIKVGHSDNPERRLANLFKSSTRYSAPKAVYEARGTQTMLRVIDGDLATERAIHDALDDFAAGCEWFVDEPELRDYIAAVEGDSWSERRHYPKLDRAGGFVDLPYEERAGSNAELALAVWRKKHPGSTLGLSVADEATVYAALDGLFTTRPATAATR
jgi:hypothetical protein